MHSKNKKLTIGIDIESHVAQLIARQVKKWQGLPLRLHAPESYHISVVQLGWVHEDLVNDVITALTNVSLRQEMLRLQFTEIAPIWKKRELKGDLSHANALRCVGVENEGLKNLYESILKELGMVAEPVKHFAPHITLGQMRANAWQEYDEQNQGYPEMRCDLPFEVDVSAITLFEHTVIEGKKEFSPLEIFELS